MKTLLLASPLFRRNSFQPPAFMLFSHTEMSDVERLMKKSGRSQRKIKARCDYFLRRTRKINHAILAKEHSIVRLFPSSPPPRRPLCQTSGDRAGRPLDADLGPSPTNERVTNIAKRDKWLLEAIRIAFFTSPEVIFILGGWCGEREHCREPNR